MTRFRIAVLLPFTCALAACSSSSTTSSPSTAPEIVAAPTFTPDPKFAFGTPFDVTIASTTAGATIRYTLDGTDPTAASSIYTEPITLTTTTVLRAVASRAGMDPSPVTSAGYTYKLVKLQVDDGTWDQSGGSAAGWGDRHLKLTRFTLGASELPYCLRTVSVLFVSPPALGTTYDIVVYGDDDTDLGNGATLDAVFAVSSAYTDAVHWSTYVLPEPVFVSTATELFIGFRARDSLSNDVCDNSNPGRSWIGQWSSGPMPARPVLPDPDVGFFPNTVCNYMIRGSN